MICRGKLAVCGGGYRMCVPFWGEIYTSQLFFLISQDLNRIKVHILVRIVLVYVQSLANQLASLKRNTGHFFRRFTGHELLQDFVNQQDLAFKTIGKFYLSLHDVMSLFSRVTFFNSCNKMTPWRLLRWKPISVFCWGCFRKGLRLRESTSTSRLFSDRNRSSHEKLLGNFPRFQPLTFMVEMLGSTSQGYIRQVQAPDPAINKVTTPIGLLHPHFPIFLGPFIGGYNPISPPCISLILRGPPCRQWVLWMWISLVQKERIQTSHSPWKSKSPDFRVEAK